MKTRSEPNGGHVFMLAMTALAALNALLWVWLLWAAASLLGVRPAAGAYVAIATVTALAVPTACRATTRPRGSR